jgi:hypothetical protein
MQASHPIRALLKDSNVEQQKALNAIADLLDGLQERIVRLEEEVQAQSKARNSRRGPRLATTSARPFGTGC